MLTVIKDAKYVWYADLEKLIADTYNQPYYSMLDDGVSEYSQDSVETFDVGPEGDKYADPDGLTVEQWLAGAETEYGQTAPHPSDICNDLYRRGLLEPGFYVVHVWW